MPENSTFPSARAEIQTFSRAVSSRRTTGELMDSPFSAADAEGVSLGAGDAAGGGAAGSGVGTLWTTVAGGRGGSVVCGNATAC